MQEPFRRGILLNCLPMLNYSVVRGYGTIIIRGNADLDSFIAYHIRMLAHYYCFSYLADLHL